MVDCKLVVEIPKRSKFVKKFRGGSDLNFGGGALAC